MKRRRSDRPLPVVSIDETGSTGEYLLDGDQPTFAVCAVHFEAAIADEMVEPYLRDGRRELHFVTLRQSPAGRADIARLLRDERLTTDSCRVSVYHKPTVLAAKTVDWLLEPILAAAGHDLYAGGANVTITEFVLAHGPRACGADAWGAFMRASMTLLWNGGNEAFTLYRRALARCRYRCNEDAIAQLLWMLPDRDDALHRLAPADGTPPLLDLMVSAVYEQSLHWSQCLGWHVMEHDRSDILESWGEQLLALANPKKARELGITPSAQVRRIRLADLVPVDSREAPAVQIADVVAGACRAWLNARNGRTEHTELLEAVETAGTLELIDNWIWPGGLPPQR